MRFSSEKDHPRQRREAGHTLGVRVGTAVRLRFNAEIKYEYTQSDSRQCKRKRTSNYQHSTHREIRQRQQSTETMMESASNCVLFYLADSECHGIRAMPPAARSFHGRQFCEKCRSFITLVRLFVGVHTMNLCIK